ncbi:cysteine--tRNA ligase [Buchnera aphidicola]|uniref:cysteine--tRNA ligase n=1 Tax=Buchnera aphidicola TaxID=9 RepID=UPI00223743AB|nr:cysteine--tRNA ligase [Buchnera aphidicola]MCW5197513.1 cysteine--tRNA ligase [Buchnera aphidicola (Chaitophorus viminalis)]
MLKIFNTLTRKKEIFKSIYKKKVSIYVCGVTVYDNCHIGHARTFIFFDVVNRYLKNLGYSVKYVRNITDIDDKIIKKSTLINKNIFSFTKHVINQMNIDFNTLNILKPSFEPRVTSHIIDIINMINILILNKHAYINSQGDVLFSIKSYQNYGQLLHKKNNLNEFENNNFYKNDFVLWKKTKNTEISWKSPWGNGRPGWHIECSAINYLYFKNKLDIHGGGNDLIFPHHENERAQSECFYKEKFVNYWMHTGMIILKNKKMSKSLGNTFLIKDLINNFSSDVIRYYFLSTKYKHPIYYNVKNLIKVNKILRKWYFCINLSIKKNYNFSFNHSSIFYINLFKNAMNDSFDTPLALLILSNLAKKIIILYDMKKFKKAIFLSSLLHYLGSILGFFNFNINSNNLNYIKDINLYKKIEKIIKKRNYARKLKLWKKADHLREKLLKFGIYIKDTKNETLWNF